MRDASLAGPLLLCSGCGKVVEFEFEAFEILQRDVASKHGFRLSSHHHELVGTCPECLRRGPIPEDEVEDDGAAPADGENAG